MAGRTLRRCVLSVVLIVTSASACSDLTEQDTYKATDVGRPDPIYKPSTHRGGTLRLATSAKWDSMDPALAFQPEARNFLRNYARTLTVVRSSPTESDFRYSEGVVVVPDLAAELGMPSNDAKTWTYTLREDVTYEDGSPVTAADVVYGIERSRDRKRFPQAPDWFAGALKSVSAPNDRTVVFELTRPLLNFDDFAQLPATAPVPRSRDNGADYGDHVLATGPYKFANVVPGKHFELVRNSGYNAKTDPLSMRTALPKTITIDADVPQSDLTRRLREKELDMQIGATREESSLLSGRVLGEPQPKDKVVTAALPQIAYTVINPLVEPLTMDECRQGVLFAADRAAYARAYGDPAVVRVATGLLPPLGLGVPVVQTSLTSAPTGDVAAATAALSKCKAPNGFKTIIAFREGRPAERTAAEALRTSLARVHIDLELKAFPAGDFYTKTAGNTSYATKHGIGLIMSDRSAPWPDAEVLLRPIVDGAAGGTAANVDLRYVEEAKNLLQGPTKDTAVSARRNAWVRIDEFSVLGTFVIPGGWGQNSIVRPSRVTNLFINDAFGQFDYTRLGKS